MTMTATSHVEEPHGAVTEPGTLRLERLLPGPIERVWEYLTDPDKRALWLAGGAMDLRVGGTVTLEFDHSRLSAETAAPERYAGCADEPFRGTITACDPPRLLSYTWAEGHEPATEVTFELSPSGDRVRLVLSHRRLEGHELMVGVSSGWHAHLGILADRLEGREPRPFWTTMGRLEKDYQRLLTAGI